MFFLEYKLDRESPMLGKAGAPAAFPAELCTVGVPRDPWDFLARAIEVGHPRPLAIHVNDEVTQMLQENFSGDLRALVKGRAAFLMHWTNRCKELEQDEKQLHQSLEPHLQQVLQGKRLLVFQEMLNDLGYPDNALVQDNLQGLSVDWVAAKIWGLPSGVEEAGPQLGDCKETGKGGKPWDLQASCFA